MLAARLEGITFEPVGALELKGFPEPVEAFAVPWTRLADETAGVGGWPLPTLLRSAPQAAFGGRDEERSLMERSRSAVRAGAQLVLVSGRRQRQQGGSLHHSSSFDRSKERCERDVRAGRLKSA
jgi:hypothetical protein